MRKYSTKSWKMLDSVEHPFNKDDWRIRTSNVSQDRYTILYYCKNKFVNECQADLKVDYTLDKERIISICYDSNHNLECSRSLFNSIPTKDISNKIKALFDSGITRTGLIQRSLSAENITVTMNNISSIICRYKKQKTVHDSCFTRNDVDEFCAANRYTDSNKPFVMAYTADPIRVFMTMKKNCELLSKSTNLHVDGTYKLNIYRFPVIVIGFSDFDKRFICTGICFVQNENKETYLWILQEIKKYLGRNSLKCGFKNVIGDNAEAITSAVNEFDESLLRTNCWAHIKRLIDAKIKSLESTVRNEFLSDLIFMQNLTDLRVFNKLKILLRKKYESLKYTSDFIEMFFNNYMCTNNNWYEAYDVFAPSTNNATERFNLLIKEKYTNWKRLNFNEFVTMSFEIMMDFSKKSFNLHKIVYDKSEMISGKIFNFKLIKRYESEEILLCYVDNVEATDQIKFHGDFDNFNECMLFYKSIVYITRSFIIKTWKDLYCSCSYFSKNKKCFHVYKYLVFLKLDSLIDVNLMSLKNPGEDQGMYKEMQD